MLGKTNTKSWGKKMTNLKIYTDGGYSPVHKTGAWCYIKGENKPQFGQLEESDVEVLTSNTMEFIAIFTAIDSLEFNIEATIISDSKLAVNQLSKQWNINYPHLQNLANKIWKLIKSRKLKITFEWISRNDNPAGHFIECNGGSLIGKSFHRRKFPDKEDDW